METLRAEILIAHDVYALRYKATENRKPKMTAGHVVQNDDSKRPSRDYCMEGHVWVYTILRRPLIYAL